MENLEHFLKLFAYETEASVRAYKFKKAVELNPISPKAHYNLGIALMCLAKYNEALVELDKAYGLAPSTKYTSAMAKCNVWKRDAERLQKQIEEATK